MAGEGELDPQMPVDEVPGRPVDEDLGYPADFPKGTGQRALLLRWWTGRASPRRPFLPAEPTAPEVPQNKEHD